MMPIAPGGTVWHTAQKGTHWNDKRARPDMSAGKPSMATGQAHKHRNCPQRVAARRSPAPSATSPTPVAWFSERYVTPPFMRADGISRTTCSPRLEQKMSWKSQEEPCGIRRERFRNLSAWLRDHVIVDFIDHLPLFGRPTSVPYLVARFR